MAILDDEDFNVLYSIHSELGLLYERRYCQVINGKIQRRTGTGELQGSVGSVSGYRLLLGEAMSYKLSAEDIFDQHHETMELGKLLFDFEQWDWKEAIQEQCECNNFNVLILSVIEIYPEYRGKGLGKYVLKDFYTNFISGSGLFVTEVFPLQFSQREPIEGEEYHKRKMEYELFSADFDESINKLRSYCLQIGMFNLLGLPNEILVIDPARRNKRFHNLKLK
jgi:hypothetical protein